MIASDTAALPYDPAEAVIHLRTADPALARLIDAAGPINIRPAGSPYQELVRAILYQQLGGAAAGAIERRFQALYPHGSTPTPEELLATPVDLLRSVGISRPKAAYLLDLAAKAVAGVIGDDLAELPDEAVIARITAVKGVGRWTADMLLLFCLHRTDVLPVGDLGIRKGIQRLYSLADLPDPVTMERIAEPWRPWRSMASRYLWCALDVAAL